MALFTTSLNAAFPKNATTLTVVSPTGAVVGGIVRVNGEFSVITVVNGFQIEVRSRGSYGGIAVDHPALSPVTFAQFATDLAELGVMETVPVPTGLENLGAIGADGAIPVPNRNTTYLITKPLALAASAMPNPLASQDGLEVGFLSLTDAAHVVNLVTSSDGTTGNTTIYTFAAFKGAGFKVKAVKGTWMLLYQSGVTPT